MVAVAETVNVTDFPQTPTAPAITVAETINITDSSQAFTSAVIRVAETIGITDSPTLTPVPPLPPPTRVTVTVASPKVAEVWLVGTTQNIVWATTGEGIVYINIYYSTDGGRAMISIARNEPNDGIYTWTVPNTPSKTALVRVLALNVKGETLALGDSGLITISIR
jgi:hypothetical protein